MRYETLGPLRLVNGDHAVTVNSRRIQVILAMLLIRAGEMVTRDQIVDELWEESPPRRAGAAVHVYVSQLRKLLRSAGKQESPVVTRGPGYVLYREADEFDFDLFSSSVDRGRRLVRNNEHSAAARALNLALSLWRGPALDGLYAGNVVSGFVTRLNESRFECLEMLSECRLASGLHRELIGPLRSMVAEHPLRESFHRQLMVALYRSDRRADALHAYHAAHKVLDDQLGIRPGKLLRQTHEAILRADEDSFAGSDTSDALLP